MSPVGEGDLAKDRTPSTDAVEAAFHVWGRVPFSKYSGGLDDEVVDQALIGRGLYLCRKATGAVFFKGENYRVYVFIVLLINRVFVSFIRVWIRRRNRRGPVYRRVYQRVGESASAVNAVTGVSAN